MRFLASTYAEILVGTYYRRFRHGTVSDKPGGMVIYTNHSNGLIDGQLSLFLTERNQSILAKASLFRIPILSWLIRQVGAIPIYRQKDQVDMSLNEDSFREVHARLLAGGALVIYPEGESRVGYRLRPFKTGAARMGLGAQAKDLEGAQPSVRFQPAGFVYEEPKTWASRAHLWPGEPIEASQFMESYAADERETVRQVTEHLKQQLERCTIPAVDHGTFRSVVQLDRALHASPEGAPPRLQALAKEWDALRAEVAGPLDAFGQRLDAWTRSLQALGLEGYDMTGPRFVRTTGSRLCALLSLALTVILVPLWLPPIALARIVGILGRSTPDKLVTVTVISASVFVPLWGLLCAWLAPWPGGFGLSLGLMVLWAVVAILWVRRAVRPRPMRRAWTNLGLQGSAQTVDSLWIEKQNLCQEWKHLTGEDRLANP